MLNQLECDRQCGSKLHQIADTRLFAADRVFGGGKLIQEAQPDCMETALLLEYRFFRTLKKPLIAGVKCGPVSPKGARFAEYRA